MPDLPTKAIFLSYARDDAAAARRIAEALRSSRLDVWFDENELRGGDTWDAKIRQQINDCALFLPVISQHTEARAKGYFRLEWKLAVDQTHLLAAGVPFLAPVVIDDTKESGASVPAEFLRVQWTRLPGALPTPQFVEQVKRLLATPTKPTPSDVARVSRPLGSDHTGQETRATKPRIPAAAWLAAAAVIAIGVTATFLTRRSPAPATPPPANALAPTLATAPLTEARQLVTKARSLYEPWDFATREDFELADQLLKKATDLDPSDSEAWAARAIMSAGMIVMSHDSSDARKKIAEAAGERAVKLSPQSDLARFARAFSLRFNPKTTEDCIRLLREAVARQPGNRLVLRTLASTLRNSGQPEQSLVYFGQAIALPGSDPISHYGRAMALWFLSRNAEAEAATDEALTVAPSYPGAIRLKIQLLVLARGDLIQARAYLAKAPSSFFLTEQGVYLAALTALWSRDYAQCLEILRPARDYLSSSSWDGPKAYLSGRAHVGLGNRDAAFTEFRAALRVVEAQFATQPNSSGLLVWRTKLNAALGDRAAVEPLLRELRQRSQIPSERIYISEEIESLLWLNETDQVLTALEAALEAKRIYSLYRNTLLNDPAFDPLRSTPRFKALLKQLEQKK